MASVTRMVPRVAVRAGRSNSPVLMATRASGARSRSPSPVRLPAPATSAPHAIPVVKAPTGPSSNRSSSPNGSPRSWTPVAFRPTRPRSMSADEQTSLSATNTPTSGGGWAPVSLSAIAGSSNTVRPKSYAGPRSSTADASKVFYSASAPAGVSVSGVAAAERDFSSKNTPAKKKGKKKGGKFEMPRYVEVPANIWGGQERKRLTTDGLRWVAACVPARQEADGSWSVLIVEANTGGWVFPKGGWEDDESAEQCAVRETEEEAGVKGDTQVYLGTIDCVSKKGRPTPMKGYFLRVTKELKDYKEKGERKRMWVPADKAVSLLSTIESRTLLERAMAVPMASKDLMDLSTGVASLPGIRQQAMQPKAGAHTAL